jgi:hypothetical protein
VVCFGGIVTPVLAGIRVIDEFIGYALILPLFPDAMRRGALLRRSGIAVYAASEFRKIPSLRRTTACCAAPGIRIEVSRDSFSGGNSSGTR